MRQIDRSNFVEILESVRRDFQKKYFAMYSSVFGGIVTDPALMLIPADDHIVHRGDGVFETFKCVNGSIYNMRAHLDRLAESAAGLQLALPRSLDQIAEIVAETVRAGNRRECAVRVLISRGPGSLGISPYDCPKSQLYVIAYLLPEPFMKTHPQGARAITSSIAVKHPLLATIKTCNYLPNMLMQKEAAEAGVDFAVAYDETGRLAEGATENMGVVTRDKRLLFPRPGHILQGTTMLRVADLAKSLVKTGDLAAAAFADISRDDVATAAEVLILGTTRDVTALVELDGRKIADGKPGPICKRLSDLLERDMRENTDLLTQVFQKTEDR